MWPVFFLGFFLFTSTEGWLLVGMARRYVGCVVGSQEACCKGRQVAREFAQRETVQRSKKQRNAVMWPHPLHGKLL